MRLLDTETYELRDHAGYPVKYAILSHRWYSEEITFNTLDPVRLRDKTVFTPQLNKIRGACDQARDDGWKWIWIDSYCIDKTSSEEVARSIRSMFQWYRKAETCYTYLTDVSKSAKSRNVLESAPGNPSEWFERGWTLQELLAPRKMTFFDTSWNEIGDKLELAPAIERITGISARYLRDIEDFRTASVATRLSWQASRKTTQIEDMAYSLFGILDVALTPMYGEGREAFMRLQRELVDTRPDESLFAWTAPTGSLPSHGRSSSWSPDEWGLLAPSPDCFRDSRDVVIGNPFRNRPPGSIAVTREGVRFPMTFRELQSTTRMVAPLHFVLPFSPVLIDRIRHKHQKVFAISLNCWRRDSRSDPRPIELYLSRDGTSDDAWRRCMCSELGLDEKMYRGSLSRRTKDVTILQPSSVRWPNE